MTQIIYDFDALAKGIRQIRENRAAIQEAVVKEDIKEKEYVEHLQTSALILLEHGEWERVAKVFDSLGLPMITMVDKNDGEK